ncbi:MAG: hypothetical protein KBD06_04285 [Candidatus Pacebacteria bacterium]|nr:hypothetical protein [Candidatus Paceibacterota bacterium]
MQFFRSHFFRQAVAFAIGAAVGVIYFLSVVSANADTLPNISIGQSGQVSVKGALVTQVGRDRIIAVSKWGGTKIVWTIAVTRASKFTPDHSGGSLTSVVSVGEHIGFSGQLDQRNGAFIVYPSHVRNESVMQDSSVVSGNIVESTADGLVVSTKNGTSTILIGTGTLMTHNGNKAAVSDLALGGTIKAFGTFNTRERTLAASRIVSVSEELPKIPNTGAPSSPNLFSRIMTWLGYSGSLTSR